MNNSQIGNLIRTIRIEKNMTQVQLAEKLNVTDKAVSKWERGMGSPDISFLPELSQILGVNIEKLLEGRMQSSAEDKGNLKKVKFFVCQWCGSTLTATGEAEVSCCGRKLYPMIPKSADDSHRLLIEEVESDYFVTIDHEMDKSHYIGFIAYVTTDKLILIRLYPEQNAQVRIPKIRGGVFYYYCTYHGLWQYVHKQVKK